MPVYVVTYDLISKNGESRDYEPVWEALAEFPRFQALYSVFLVQAVSAAAIETALVGALRKNDRYLIDRMRPSEFKFRAMVGINDWLADHVPV